MSWRQNTEAERSALAIVLNHPPLQAMMLSVLEPDDFHLGLHVDVFKAAKRIHLLGKTVDDLAVFGELKDQYTVGDIFAISDGVPVRFETYQSVIDELRANRKLRGLVDVIDKAHREIMEESPGQSVDADELLAHLEEKLAEIRYVGGAECEDTDELLARHNVDICRDPAAIEREFIRAGQWHEFSKSFPFERRALSGIAARPGGGKSSFMLHMLAQLAKAGYVGCFFSIEMDRRAVMNRLLSCVSGIPKWKFRHGDADADDRGFAFGELSKLTRQFMLRFQSRIRVSQIAADLYRWKAAHGLDFFIVDYLQIIDDSEYTFKKRYEAIGQITRGLRDLSRQLDCAGVIGIQVGRDAEKSAGARHIRLSDFRESGNIENDLDAAVGLNLIDCTEAVDNVEVEILKNREGVRGKIVKMTHRKDYNSWAETVEFSQVDARIQA